MEACADAVEVISRAIATAATARTHFLKCIPSPLLAAATRRQRA
jgi:hypothetical protein